MILELATIDIKAGKNADFEKNLALAQSILQGAMGYLGHQFQQCIEQDNRYILLIRWETVEAHTVGFRQSKLFQEWRALIGEFFESAPVVQHFELKFEK